LLRQWTDWSGTVHVSLYVCDWIPGHVIDALCEVAPDEVVVGGGGEVEYEDAPGALLFEARPYGFSKFRARSKDHTYSYSHSLRAYALGLRLDGVSQQKLQEQLRMDVEPSDWAYHMPSATASIPDDHVLVGGGVEASYYPGLGQLIVQSIPSWSPHGWSGKTKDHGASYEAFMATTVLSLPACPEDYAGCLASTFGSYDGPHGTGYQGVEGWAVPGYAMTSIGVEAHSDNFSAGRLLTDLIPTVGDGVGGVIARTKDHEYVESGWTRAYVVGLKKL